MARFKVRKIALINLDEDVENKRKFFNQLRDVQKRLQHSENNLINGPNKEFQAREEDD